MGMSPMIWNILHGNFIEEIQRQFSSCFWRDWERVVFSLEILGKCGRGRTTGAARWPANPASFCKIIYRLLEYAISPTPTLLKDTLLKIWLWKILFQKIHFWRKAQSLLEKKHSARSQFVLVQMTCNNTAKVEPQLAFLEKVDLSRDPVSSLPARAARPPMTDGSIRPTRTSFSSQASAQRVPWMKIYSPSEETKEKNTWLFSSSSWVTQEKFSLKQLSWDGTHDQVYETLWKVKSARTALDHAWASPKWWPARFWEATKWFPPEWRLCNNGRACLSITWQPDDLMCEQ